MLNIDKNNKNHFKYFNRRGYDFLEKHIELSEYQKNKIFLGGRQLGKTYAMYMTLMLKAIEQYNEPLQVTLEVIKFLDEDTADQMSRSTLKRVVDEFNYVSEKYFDNLFNSKVSTASYNDRLQIEVDVDKLRYMHPEMMV